MTIDEILAYDWPHDPDSTYEDWVKMPFECRQQLAAILMVLGAERFSRSEGEYYAVCLPRTDIVTGVFTAMYLSYDNDEYIVHMPVIKRFLKHKGYTYGHTTAG